MADPSLIEIGRKALQAGYYDAEGGLSSIGADATVWQGLLASQEGVDKLCMKYHVSQADIEGSLTEALSGMRTKSPATL